ncbi:MAG: ABC transporter permease, partial [Acidobacteria bacterium]|nr:ABC transporter permease [Acidobacteriota bacterium]
PDYLKVMHVPLLRGRFISEQDTDRSLHVAVVDEEFARKFFPKEDPLGKRLNLSEKNFVEIVGVVGHVNQWGLDTDAKENLRAEMYLSLTQLPDAAMDQVASGVGVLVRSKTDAPNLFASIRDHLNHFDGNVIVYSPQTMDETIAATLAARRFAMLLLSIFAALAVLLASIGVYGVLSYLVGQRTQEIGVRMSLGAQRADVLGLILRDGARFTLVGIGLGLLAALALTRLMSSMLFGISASDPLTYLSVSTLLCAVAFLACYVPAHRAMNVNPVVALRHE